MDNEAGKSSGTADASKEGKKPAVVEAEKSKNKVNESRVINLNHEIDN